VLARQSDDELRQMVCQHVIDDSRRQELFYLHNGLVEIGTTNRDCALAQLCAKRTA
jgi:hypothetical protein